MTLDDINKPINSSEFKEKCFVRNMSTHKLVDSVSRHLGDDSVVYPNHLICDEVDTDITMDIDGVWYTRQRTDIPYFMLELIAQVGIIPPVVLYEGKVFMEYRLNYCEGNSDTIDLDEFKLDMERKFNKLCINNMKEPDVGIILKYAYPTEITKVGDGYNINTLDSLGIGVKYNPIIAHGESFEDVEYRQLNLYDVPDEISDYMNTVMLMEYNNSKCEV